MLHRVFFDSLIVWIAVLGEPAVAATKPNILFIVADDLRPDLGCYGHSGVHSPNLDRLATRGLLFERAYCQVALCNPSRTSLLTGLRPDTTQIYGNAGHFRDRRPDAVTMPQHFKSHGYTTQALGKIFHPGCEDEPSWSAPTWQPTAPRYGPEGRAIAAERAAKARQSGKRVRKQDELGPPWEAADAADEQLTDGETATQAIRAMAALQDRPFFLAVGFLVPHLPFVAPKKYWDRYPRESIRLATNPLLPRDLPECAIHHWSELRAFVGMPAAGPLDDQQAREAIRGYRAATSFLDAQVGRVLDELDRLALRDKTIVVFLGDHGWQLGEHAHWCKHTNFDIALRAPLIISAPGANAAGRKTAAIVEFVDLYSTLAELCGLPQPTAVDGLSFAPLFHAPREAWKRAAFSQYQRNVPNLGLAMGRSVRTNRYRFTEWTVPEKDFVARELYYHQIDADENSNLANRPDQATLVAELTRILHGAKNELVNKTAP
jgi:arylsulfatase A-like enzyme